MRLVRFIQAVLFITATSVQTKVPEEDRTFLGIPIPAGCPRGYSCDGRCNLNVDRITTSRTCHCDKHCPVFGDCCFDYFSSCENLVRYDQVVNYLHGIRSTYDIPTNTYNDVSRISQFSSCHTINDGSAFRSVYMIDKCPSGSDEDVRKKCEKSVSAFPLNAPVTNRWNMNEIFVNVFCALCNGIHKSDMLTRNGKLLCKKPLAKTSTTLYNLDTLLEDCKIIVEYERIMARSCDPRLTHPKCHHASNTSAEESEVNPSWELDLLCHGYTHPVQVSTTTNIYRNPHCYTCETGIDPKVDGYKCPSENIPHETGDFAQGRTTYNIRISLDDMSYDLISEDGVIVTPGISCPVDKIPNIMLNRCENKGHCSYSSLLVENSGCFQIYHGSKQIDNSNGRSLYMKVKFDMFSKPNFTNAVSELQSSMVAVLQDVLHLHGFEQGKTSIKISSVSEFINWNSVLQQDNSEDSSRPANHMTYESSIRIHTEETLSNIITILQITFLQFNIDTAHTVYPVEMIISNSADLTKMQCEIGQKNVFKTVGLMRSEDDMYAMFGISKTLVNLKDSGYSIVLTRQYGVMHLETLVLCLTNNDALLTGHAVVTELQCPVVTFQENEYSITDGILTLLETDLTVQKENYVVNGRVVSLCQDTIKKMIMTRDLHPQFHIYKAVLLSICASCMLIIVFVKIKNRMFMDTDSKLLLGEVSCLMVIFLIDIFEGLLHSGGGRMFLSAVTHLFWLVVFSLHAIRASCIIKESHRNYNSVALQKSVSISRKRFLFLLLSISSVSIVCMVIISLTLDKHHPTVYIGYGQGKVLWWMGNCVALLVTFALPSGLAILSASWCLLYDLWYGRKARTAWVCRHRSASSISVSVLLFILLCFGLSGEFTDQQALGYLYYTVHVVLSLFLLYTTVITDLVIQTYEQTRDYHEPVTIITQTRML